MIKTMDGYQIAEMWYAKARYYNSDLGSFATEDSIKGNILDIQSLNLYPYVKNNPLKYIDPDGRRLKMVQIKVEDWTGYEGIYDIEAANKIKNNSQNIIFKVLIIIAVILLLFIRYLTLRY